jgi:hypothetical protein
MVDVELARVSPDGEENHPTLFPVAAFTRPPPTSDDICKSIGLNRWGAQQLHLSGWLSFDPKAVRELTPAQAAELRFLGTLVAAGCDQGLLKQMLMGLRKPYAYRLDLLYYDWIGREWRLLPLETSRRDQLEHWLEELEDRADTDKLQRLRDMVEDHLRAVRRSLPR